MDKTDYFDKMDALVKNKQTYQELKRNPTPAIQWKLNRKIFTLKKTDTVDIQHYYRLSCSVPQPPTLYGLLELHKPGIPMQAIVSFCGSPTYQLSKYLTTTLQPLTDKSQRKLQSMGNFIAAIKTVQIPDNYKLVSFDVKSLFTGIPLQLALQSTKTAIQQSTIKLLLPTEDIMDLLDLCFTSTFFQYNSKNYKQLHGTAMGRLFLLLSQKLCCNMWKNMPLQLANKQYRFGYTTLTTLLLPFTKTKLTLSTTTLMNWRPTSSLPKKSKKMKNFLF